MDIDELTLEVRKLQQIVNDFKDDLETRIVDLENEVQDLWKTKKDDD